MPFWFLQIINITSQYWSMTLMMTTEWLELVKSLLENLPIFKLDILLERSATTYSCYASPPPSHSASAGKAFKFRSRPFIRHMVGKACGHALMLCTSSDPLSTLSFLEHISKFCLYPLRDILLHLWPLILIMQLLCLLPLISPFPKDLTWNSFIFEIIIFCLQNFAICAYHVCYTVPYALGAQFEVSYYKIMYKLEAAIKKGIH